MQAGGASARGLVLAPEDVVHQGEFGVGVEADELETGFEDLAGVEVADPADFGHGPDAFPGAARVMSRRTRAPVSSGAAVMMRTPPTEMSLVRQVKIPGTPGWISPVIRETTTLFSSMTRTSRRRSFYALGMPMFQGYGLTEAAPVVSANSLKAHKLGSSGRVAPGIELRILDDQDRELPAGKTGEIVVRGENVMSGYWKNEKASREALRDGWLYTGDLGYLDTDGFLFVLGRMKSLLIASDGEKYSPEVIEEAITDASPYVEQIMLYNNQSPFTVALLVPNKDALLRWLRDQGLSPKTPEGQEAALRLIERQIDAFREGGAHAGEFPARSAALGRRGPRRGLHRTEPFPQFDPEDGPRPHHRFLSKPARSPLHARGQGHRPYPEPGDHQPARRRAVAH